MSNAFGQINRNKVTTNNNWREIGEVKAGYSGDQDAIFVNGPFDDFRKIKFRVSNAAVNMHRMVITYENGGKDEVPLKLVINKGDESRNIDLKGGKRRIRKIEFWFDTKGRFSGKARVTVYGRR
jgi:hypothetical protein